MKLEDIVILNLKKEFANYVVRRLKMKRTLYALARLLKIYENSYFLETQKPDCILIEIFLYFG